MTFIGNAFLVQGDTDTVPTLLEMLADDGIEIEGNPDLYRRVYTHFGIDEARELRERANSRSITDVRRIFILVAPGLTNEAQNALLKTLEEPPAGAQFFIVIPSPETLLGTLRSRTQSLDLGMRQSLSIVDARTFLKSTPRARIEMLKPLLEKDEDDKRDIGGVITFLSSLERILTARAGEESAREGIEAIYRARKYAGDKGSLTKALLEHVALLAPVI